MQILFTGNKPQKKTYSYSVKENNNSNKISFILDKVQEGLDLSTLSCFVKVQGLEIDKDVPTIEIEEDKIKVNWTLLRKHTDSRVLSVQLQFEGHGDVVWQSEILQLVLSDTIKADEYIENKYPAVLTNHEERITDLEGGAVSDLILHQSDIVDNLESEATNKPLSAKQGKTLAQRIAEAIAGVFHYKGSVATYEDLPSENLEIGDTWNVEKTGDNYAWSGTLWDKLSGIVDLSNFYTKGETDTLLEDKADTSDLDNYALLEQGFNVINATDIVNNTLTQAQYDLITNGKQTKILGTIANINDGTIISVCVGTTITKTLLVGSDATNIFNSKIIEINNGNKSLTFSSNKVRLQFDNGKFHFSDIASINGKPIPAYPTDTTKNYTMKYINGQMVWVEDN